MLLLLLLYLGIMGISAVPRPGRSGEGVDHVQARSPAVLVEPGARGAGGGGGPFAAAWLRHRRQCSGTAPPSTAPPRILLRPATRHWRVEALATDDNDDSTISRVQLFTAVVKSTPTPPTQLVILPQYYHY